MSQLYQQRPDIPARDVEGVMAVITPRSSQIHRLNGVATEIWGLCGEEGGATRDELLEALAGIYSVTLEVLENDLDAFLKEATQKGILLVSG